MTAILERYNRSDILAECQVPLVALLLLAVTIALFGVVPAATAAAGTGVVAAVAHRQRARRDVVVVGDAEFCARATAAARGRRDVVAHVTVDDQPLEVPACDEIVVDGRVLPRLWASEPVLPHDATLRIAAGGLIDETMFVDPLGTAERMLKRALDMVGAVVGLLLCLPVLLVMAAAIKLDSPGPVLFGQERMGEGGRRFRVLKLRTMFVDNDGSAHLAYVAALMRGEAEAENGVYKLVHDPRITRVGRWLRKLSLDELPQLANVLRGDMSLVGPRPPMVDEAKLYDDWAWQRLRVKPGLTGLWQVSGRCELDFHDMVALDRQYWEAWTPLLELRILLKTPAAVLSSRGAA